jgi:deoxyribodipyrimidine photo-lyase
MRMYWAKKLLEWSASPEEALQTGMYLNDTYSIDGGDPNGYVGLLWSIAGLHDRPWSNRPVYGSIRYMSANGLRRKFDTDSYVRQWNT